MSGLIVTGLLLWVTMALAYVSQSKNLANAVKGAEARQQQLLQRLDRNAAMLEEILGGCEAK